PAPTSDARARNARRRSRAVERFLDTAAHAANDRIDQCGRRARGLDQGGPIVAPGGLALDRGHRRLAQDAVGASACRDWALLSTQLLRDPYSEGVAAFRPERRCREVGDPPTGFVAGPEREDDVRAVARCLLGELRARATGCVG